MHAMDETRGSLKKDYLDIQRKLQLISEQQLKLFRASLAPRVSEALISLGSDPKVIKQVQGMAGHAYKILSSPSMKSAMGANLSLMRTLGGYESVHGIGSIAQAKGAARLADGLGAARLADGLGAARLADGLGAARLVDGLGAARLADGLGAARLADGLGAARLADGLGAARLLLDDIAVRNHLNEMLRFSTKAQAYLSGLDPKGIGSLLAIDSNTKARLARQLALLSKVHEGVCRSVENLPQAMPYLRSGIYGLPTRGYVSAVDLVDSSSIPREDDEYAEDRLSIRQELVEEGEYAIPALLARIDPSLQGMWDGARDALRSDSCDKTRHVCTSLRELFTHVLHRVSPDDQIQAWASNPSMYVNGRPTRKTRLKFLFRKIASQEVRVYGDQQISAILAFMDALQKGTHEPLSPYTECQLEAIMVWMECHVRLLLQVAVLDQ